VLNYLPYFYGLRQSKLSFIQGLSDNNASHSLLFNLLQSQNIIKARDVEMAKKYQGQFSAQGMNGAFGPAQPASGNPTLTPEERGAAHAMGLSDEDYLKYRGA